MSELWVRRIGSHLHADGNESLAELVKLPLGESMHCVVRRPRNLAHHRLYWVIVNRIAAGVGCEPQNISDVLKLATGHCTVVHTKRYGNIRLPRSISFAAMDQDAFAQFYERALVTIFEEWGIERSVFADLQL